MTMRKIFILFFFIFNYQAHANSVYLVSNPKITISNPNTENNTLNISFDVRQVLVPNGGLVDFQILYRRNNSSSYIPFFTIKTLQLSSHGVVSPLVFNGLQIQGSSTSYDFLIQYKMRLPGSTWRALRSMATNQNIPIYSNPFIAYITLFSKTDYLQLVFSDINTRLERINSIYKWIDFLEPEDNFAGEFEIIKDFTSAKESADELLNLVKGIETLVSSGNNPNVDRVKQYFEILKKISGSTKPPFNTILKSYLTVTESLINAIDRISENIGKGIFAIDPSLLKVSLKIRKKQYKLLDTYYKYEEITPHIVRMELMGYDQSSIIPSGLITYSKKSWTNEFILEFPGSIIKNDAYAGRKIELFIAIHFRTEQVLIIPLTEDFVKFSGYNIEILFDLRCNNLNSDDSYKFSIYKPS